MTKQNEEFTKKIIADWKTCSSAPLSAKDAKEIARNIAEFFDLLNALDEKYGGNNEQA